MRSSTNFSVAKHLGDPLAAKILEITGFEDAEHIVLDIERERLFLLALETC